MLNYLDKQLSKQDKRNTIRYMSQYRNLEAIIESKRMDIGKSHVQGFEENESQSTFSFHSECEDYAIQKEEVEEYERIKKKLDIAYKHLKPLHKEIWEERYITGKYDTDVYHDLRIEKKAYYAEKKELINIVAECLGIK